MRVAEGCRMKEGFANCKSFSHARGWNVILSRGKERVISVLPWSEKIQARPADFESCLHAASELQ